jgi:hypothetical protein
LNSIENVNTGYCTIYSRYSFKRFFWTGVLQFEATRQQVTTAFDVVDDARTSRLASQLAGVG